MPFAVPGRWRATTRPADPHRARRARSVVEVRRW